jgi:PhnB protein
MMGEAQGEWRPMPCALYVYLENCDAVYQRALQAGATSIMEPADQFYGDRHGAVKDPCGNLWWIATHIEDVSNEEIARRTANPR